MYVLIEAGGNINSLHNNVGTALMRASIQKYLKYVTKGPQLGKKLLAPSINATIITISGRTTLHVIPDFGELEAENV